MYDEFNIKLENNKVKLDKPYLKPNYSNFEFKHFPNKEPFLTSNKRDFKPFSIEHKEKNKNLKEFIQTSKLVLGEYPYSNKLTTYQELLNDPKSQKSKFNYDKIHFKYNPHNIHPITGEFIFKPTHNNWHFDYYDKDKPKNFTIINSASYINKDFRKVYDPITNRILN